MVKLRRLLVEKYRIVKPGTELSFNDGYNVLLGINGTGKTTLLNLIAMCLSASFPGLEEEEFALQYELAIPEGILKIDIRNEHIEPGPGGRTRFGHHPLHLEPRERNLAPSIDLQFTSGDPSFRAFHLSLTRGALALDGNLIERIATPYLQIGAQSCIAQVLFFVLVQDLVTETTFRQIIASLEPEHLYSRYDEGTEWFREVVEQATLTFFVMDAEYIEPEKPNCIATALQDAVRQRVRESELSRGRLPRPEVPTFRHDELPFLAQAVNAFNYRDGSLRLELRSVEPQPDWETHVADLLTFGNLRIFFTKRDGSFLSLDRLSFGQKRLVAFYYYLATYPSVLIADELANGMHHAMIADCLQAAGERQKFLATQNPLLIDHVPLGSAQEVRSTFIRCSLAVDGLREQMVWSSLTEDESIEFFKDYEVGIQHTNDILRLRGLW